MRLFATSLLVAFAATVLAPMAQAIEIKDFSKARHDRFENDSSFIASDIDLSGVGIDEDGKWLTMLSPNVFVSATHFQPDVGASVTFYAGNDPNGPSVTRTVSPITQEIGRDTFVGTLDSPLPASYAEYPFATEDIDESYPIEDSERFANSPWYQAEAYLVGRSPTSRPTDQNQAVGRNVLSNKGNLDSGTIGGTDNRPGGLDDEAMLEPGDSGGPLFAKNNAGEITLLGTNWTVGSNTFSAAYLGNFDAEVQNFVDAHTIPEPGSALLLLPGLLGGLLIRRTTTSNSN